MRAKVCSQESDGRGTSHIFLIPVEWQIIFCCRTSNQGNSKKADIFSGARVDISVGHFCAWHIDFLMCGGTISGKQRQANGKEMSVLARYS